MNKKIDFKIDDRTVIHVPTKEDAVKLCYFLDSLGARWVSGERYAECNRWYWDKEFTCYNINEGKHDSLHFYESDDYKIISVDEFIELHNPKTFKEDLDVIINNIDETENLLRELLKNHDGYLLEGEKTNIGIQKIIDIGESIKLLRAANYKLFTIEELIKN